MKLKKLTMGTKLLIGAVLLATLFFSFKPEIGHLLAATSVKEEKKNKSPKKKDSPSDEYNIVKQWDLPGELNEVSGIAYISNGLFACVQDEEGTIFIYDTEKQQIIKKIPFGGPGDYEGITLNGNTAYIVRADGQLFEVKNYNTGPVVEQYKTPFTVDNNIEGLTFDKENNRLLLAVKDNDLKSNDAKGVYAFSLETKMLDENPVFSILTSEPLLKTGKKNKSIRPSAIGIRPNTGNYYVVDGPSSRVVKLDKSGKVSLVKALGSDFAKPEGITFDPGGRIFISNERGKKSSANIIEVTID